MSAFNPNGCTNKGVISCPGDTPLHWPRFVTALCCECIPMLALLWQPSSYMLYGVQAVLAKGSHIVQTYKHQFLHYNNQFLDINEHGLKFLAEKMLGVVRRTDNLMGTLPEGSTRPTVYILHMNLILLRLVICDIKSNESRSGSPDFV